MKYKIPDEIFGQKVDGAIERVLSQKGNNPIQTPIQQPHNNIDGFIYVPDINLYVAKETAYHNLNWKQTHEELHKNNQRMLILPEFLAFLKYLRTNQNNQELEKIYNEITEVRKLALAPEFNNTYLDVNILEKALTGRESFVLSISDGDIANWKQKKENIKNLAESNYFAHIQLGSKTEFSQYLESINVPVFSVNSGEDLSKLMVNITKNTYKEFTKQ